MNIELARFNMIEQQIRPCDVHDQKVLDSLLKLKREKFAPQEYQALAFSDLGIPLPGGQTMLSPRVEALLLEALQIEKSNKVLEIGAGSGYVTALLAKLADFVYTIEIDEQNKQLAAQNLTYAGISNVSVILGNGLNGLPGKAPFDRIFIGGAMLTIPEKLKAQLRVGGKLVGFVGDRPVLHAVLIERIGENQYSEKQLFETDIDYLTNEVTETFTF